MTKAPARAWRAIAAAGCLLIGNAPADEQGAVAAEDFSYYDGAPSGPTLSLDALDAILDNLEAEEPRTLSMWDQLLIWIDELLRSREQGIFPDWLSNFRLSSDTATLILWATCVLIVALAAGIVINELRHGRRRRRSAQTPSRGTAPIEPAAPPSAVVLASLPLHEQPAALLHLVLERLRLERGGRPESLTHREIARAADGLALPSGPVLNQIADIAERIRYARRLPAEADVAPIVARGRALLIALTEPPAPAKRVRGDRQ